MDYGWKTLLRGMRICLRNAMETSGIFDGRHHWVDLKLFERTKFFMERDLKFSNPSDKDIWSIVLLTNPAKGIQKSRRKDKFGRPACD